MQLIQQRDKADVYIELLHLYSSLFGAGSYSSIKKDQTPNHPEITQAKICPAYKMCWGLGDAELTCGNNKPMFGLPWGSFHEREPILNIALMTRKQRLHSPEVEQNTTGKKIIKKSMKWFYFILFRNSLILHISPSSLSLLSSYPLHPLPRESEAFHGER